MPGYGSLSRLYDDEYRDATDDISFYLKTFTDERVRGSVLDLGCGTGRVAIPLALAGFRVTGVDVSEAMLRRARRRRRLLPPDAAIRLRFSLQDISRLSQRGRFQGAVLAFSTLQMLTGRDDRRACLEGLARHLTPGGLVLADLFASGPITSPHTRFISSFRLARFGHLVEKVAEERHDLPRNVIAVRYSYSVRRWTDDRVVDTLEASFEVARVSRQEIETDLYAAGFDVEAVLGDYRGRQMEPGSPRMLFVARRL
jgi:SAM-dependent methyltransferase